MEFKRLRRGAPNTWNVPTLTERNGDFSARPASQQPRDPLNNNQPFAGGIVPASRFSPNSKRLVDNYPVPNFGGPGGNFVFEPPNPLDTNQYILKGDYYLSEKHQIAVHYLRDYYTSLQNTGNLVLYDRDIPGANSSAKWTWVAGPTTVNTFQFTFTGNVIRQGNFRPNTIFVTDYSRAGNGVNYPMLFGNETSIPSLNISGFNSLGVQPRNWNNFNRIFQFKNDFSKVLGNHTVKVGALVMRSRKNQDNQPAINGSVSYSPGHPLHSGNPLADALLGNFNTYTEASSLYGSLQRTRRLVSLHASGVLFCRQLARQQPSHARFRRPLPPDAAAVRQPSKCSGVRSQVLQSLGSSRGPAGQWADCAGYGRSCKRARGGWNGPARLRAHSDPECGRSAGAADLSRPT